MEVELKQKEPKFYIHLKLTPEEADELLSHLRPLTHSTKKGYAEIFEALYGDLLIELRGYPFIEELPYYKTLHQKVI